MDNQKTPILGPIIEAIEKAKKGGVPGTPLELKIPSALPLTTDDPNFDPDWDWTVDEPHDLFALTQNGVQIFENVRLPYYTDSGPAADDFNSDVPGVRDILAEDGWVLLSRDFGTPERGAVFPRFILYNRFRGLMRLFYFNPHFPEAFTYGVVTLQKQSASDPFGLLTFTDETNTTLSDFDSERTEVFIGRLEPVSWNYADFLVVGFDPELPDDARLQFEIAGVRESEIALEGNLSLNQVLDKTNLVASKSGELGSALALGEKTASGFKNLDGLKEAIKKSVGEEKLENVSLADMSNLVSAGIALFKMFLGGNKPKQTQVLKFKGELDLSGTIRLQGAIGSFLLRVPGARHLGNTDLPFYDKPLGVFNLRSKPSVDLKIIMEVTKCRNTGKVGPKILTLPFPKRHQHKLRRLQVIVNPEAGLKAELAVAFVRPNGTLDFAQSAGPDGYFALSKLPPAVDILKGPGNCDDPGPVVQERKVAIRLTITPEETVPDFTPITIVKLYPSEYASEVVVNN
ncbi:MAG TPA: hypothetical protein VK879_09055 [Candidatus Sulfomarinibacteraceae bacterium]|nr:hypothetical protein [Candidatus Sulfomarinibacteraceae bacterium]